MDRNDLYEKKKFFLRPPLIHSFYSARLSFHNDFIIYVTTVVNMAVMLTQW